MHSFLKAEWKTIVTVTLFAGAIFGWFYYQETLKEVEKDTPYEFTCLKAGDSLFEDTLGDSFDKLAPKIGDFIRSEDAVLGTTRFESPDHTIAYNFRNNRLASIEYYPDMGNLKDNCKADFQQFKKTNSQISATISYENRRDLPFKGLVIVQEKSDETPHDNYNDEEKYDDIGWIILPG